MKICSSQKLFRKTIKRYREIRSVSPIIAIVLLIGLTVIAMAILAILVFTFLQPNVQIEWTDGSLSYNLQETKNQGRGMGIFTVSLSNSGQEAAEIVGFKIQYKVGTQDFQDLNEAINTLEGVTSSDPATIEPSSTEIFHVVFPLVSANADNEVQYRITYLLKDGTQGPYDPDLSYGSIGPDRPTISYPDLTNGVLSTSPSKFLRRTASLQPIVNDPVGGEWKEVIYTLSYLNGTEVFDPWIITPSVNPNGYLTNWNTRLGSPKGVANKTYFLNITVIDWAGLSASITGDVKVDNDYIAPTINTPNHYFVYENGTTKIDQKTGENLGEVGNSMTIDVDVTDSGSFDSGVQTVLLWYKVNTTGYDWESVTLSKVGGTQNTYRGNIPSADVNSDAMDHNITYYIEAIDKDGNKVTNGNTTNPFVIRVTDTIKPDISFNPQIKPQATQGESFYLTATITDLDQVDTTTVVLYWRWNDDPDGANDTNSNFLPTNWVTLSYENSSGDQYSWFFDETMTTLYGIEYYIEARDRSGNVARDGDATSPNRIIIQDTTKPTISLLEPTKTTVNDDEDITVRVEIIDNDPTFALNALGFTPTYKEVTLYYRDFDDVNSPWSTTSMTLESSNSNTSRSSTWSGIIPSSASVLDGTPQLDFKIYAEDQSGNFQETTIFSLTVVSAADPILEIDLDSVHLEDTNNTLVFQINNTQAAGSSKTANIHTLNVLIFNDTQGGPLIPSDIAITEVQQVVDPSNITLYQNTTLQNRNGANLPFTTTVGLAGDTFVVFKVTFNKSTDGTPYSLVGFTANITVIFNTTTPTDTAVTFTDIRLPTPDVRLFFDDFEDATYTNNNWNLAVGNYDPASITNLGGGNDYMVLTSTGRDEGVAQITSKNFDYTSSGLVVQVKVFSVSGGGGGYENAFVIFDDDLAFDDSPQYDFKFGGARIGAQDGVAGTFTDTNRDGDGSWSNAVSTPFSWPTGVWFWMRVVINPTGTVDVYFASENSNSWTFVTGGWNAAFASNLLTIGLAEENAQTYFDDISIYELGDEPASPPSPSLFTARAATIKVTKQDAITPNYQGNVNDNKFIHLNYHIKVDIEGSSSISTYNSEFNPAVASIKTSVQHKLTKSDNNLQSMTTVVSNDSYQMRTKNNFA